MKRRELESYEDAVEYHIQPQRIFKTFTARIFDSSEQIFQDVIVYPLFLDGEVLDVEIKIPIYVQPSAIRDDVEAALWSEYQLTLGNLKFTMAPKEYSI